MYQVEFRGSERHEEKKIKKNHIFFSHFTKISGRQVGKPMNLKTLA